MVHNVYVYAVAGIGGLKNEAQRNVKPDHLRNCPPWVNEIKKPILIANRTPRNCINMLLPPVHNLVEYFVPIVLILCWSKFKSSTVSVAWVVVGMCGNGNGAAFVDKSFICRLIFVLFQLFLDM